MNPSITPARPRVAPVTSLPPVALPFVAVADAAVAEPVAVGLYCWPMTGKGGFPLTSHPLAVEEGQAGVESEEADAE